LRSLLRHKGNFAIVFRFNEALFFVLQLDVRAESVNALPTLLLQIGGLIIESLGHHETWKLQHWPRRAACDVLRYDEQDDLLACGQAVGLAGIDGAGDA